MDFDPRDFESRDEERSNARGSRSSQDDLDRDDDLRLPDVRPRGRDDDDARTLGRGPGDSRQSNADEQGRDPRTMRGGRNASATHKPLFHAVGEADSRYPRPASNHDGSSQGADDDGISWSECVV